MTAAAGVVGVACSAQVYAVTRRRWWALATTATKFFLTTVATGAAAVLVITVVVALVDGDATAERAALVWGRPLGALVATIVAAKLAWELAFLRHLRSSAPADLRRSAQLLVGDLAPSSWWRVGLGAAGALAALVMVLVAGHAEPTLVLVAVSVSFAAIVAGELIERWQFFTAVAPPRMPSGPM
jgi:DMSO reductase anchor subunit